MGLSKSVTISVIVGLSELMSILEILSSPVSAIYKSLPLSSIPVGKFKSVTTSVAAV